MKRDCFFCNVGVKTFTSHLWSLPGIEAVEIGFAICHGCGMIIQSPAVDPAVLANYYKETAVYNNPGRAGLPDHDKVVGVGRQVRFIKEIVGSVPQSVFQVGCSDGYTLSMMRDAGAELLDGVDPSVASNELASSRYNLKTTIGTFEEFTPERKYELMLMTHVLEHLYDPVEAIKKASSMQDDDGWVFIEVPLLEKVESLPPGYFTFEHLNYFSESTLLRLLDCAGYVPHFIEKLFGVYDYPAIIVIARKEKVKRITPLSDVDRPREFVNDYLSRDNSAMKAIEARVKRRLKQGTEVYIWGAGVHTTQIFARTDLKGYLKVRGLLDSSPERWGKYLGDLMCFNSGELDLGEGDTIIISSYASEQEIYDALTPLRERGVDVVRLYEED